MDFSLNLGVLDEGKLVKIDENKLYDVTVIGAGPAAVSAAIYSARKGLSVAMVGLKVGGQVLDTDGNRKHNRNYIHNRSKVCRISS